MNINGYSVSWCPSHPRVIGNSGCVYDHILQAEKMLRRKLTPEEVVHHIDGVRNNNKFSNLMVFKTKGDHTRFHKTGIFKKENDYYISPKKVCCDCGKEISSDAIRCKECCAKALRKTVRPTREELKKLIRNYSFVQIGKQFGVSDNAIRKWCVRENLPKNKAIINSYNEEEWKII